MTSGLLLNWAAISGCVSSQKKRLGSIAVPFGEPRPRGLHDFGDAQEAAVVLDGAKGRVLDRARGVAVLGRELVLAAAAAARGEELELGAEHVAFRHGELGALGVTVLAALDVERRAFVQLFRR